MKLMGCGVLVVVVSTIVAGCAVSAPEPTGEAASSDALTTATSDGAGTATPSNPYACTGTDIGTELRCKQTYFWNGDANLQGTPSRIQCSESPSGYCTSCKFVATCKVLGQPVGTSGAYCNSIGTTNPPGPLANPCFNGESEVPTTVTVNAGPLKDGEEPSCQWVRPPAGQISDQCHARDRIEATNWNFKCCAPLAAVISTAL